MIPSRIARDLALMHHKSLLISFRLTETQAEALTQSAYRLIRAVVNELRIELEHERDEARRVFYAQNPRLHDHRPIVANLSRIEARTPDAARLETARDLPIACSPSVIRAVP